MIKLIQHPEEGGYPSEYLTARISGRRSALIHDWDAIIYSTNPLDDLLATHYRDLIKNHSIDGVWIRLSEEFSWIYSQMNRTIKEVFTPFFLYCEIHTLIACIRYKTDRESGAEIRELLSFSLLEEGVKNIFIRSKDLPSTLESLEKHCFQNQNKTSRLVENLSDNGTEGVERELTALFLEHTAASDLHPSIKDFFTSLIDEKNIITAYKYLHWNIPSSPLLINGGKIRPSVFSKLLYARDTAALTALIENVTGADIKELKTSNIEKLILSSLTKKVNRKRRGNKAVDVILDYLWSTYIEARNLSIILYCKNINRDTMREELVGV